MPLLRDILSGRIPDPTFTGELKNAVPRGLGQTVQGIGQIAEDLGWEDNPIKAYGQRVIDRNPTQINSLEDIAEHPAAAFGSAIGNAASFLGPGLGLKGLMALRGVGTAGQFAAQAGLAGLPSYGGIREEQIAEGNNSPIDMLAAGAGAAVVGAIENLGGAQRMLGMGLGRTGQRAAIEEFGKTPWRTVGKTMGRGALEEGAEELVQNPIEQMAAYRDPRTEGAIDETLFGGAMGALGGLGFGGGIGAYRGLQHRALRNDLREHGYIDPQGGTPTDLLAGLENRDIAHYAARVQDEATAEDERYYNGMEGFGLGATPRGVTPAFARGFFPGAGYVAPDDMQQLVNGELGIPAGRQGGIVGLDDKGNPVYADEAKGDKSAHSRMQNEYNKMFGAGSGVFVVDPQTQQERELTLGEWHQISNLEVPRQQNTSGLNLPALRTPAEAVALLDFAHNEQQRGHPVAEGTELHQRVLEADAMLRGMGIVYRGQDRVNPNIKTPIAEAQWLRTGQQEEAKKEEPKPVVPSKTTTNLLSSLSEHLAAKTITQGEYDTAVSQLTVAEAKVHDAPKGTKQAIRKSILAPVHKSVGEMLQSKVKGAKNANGQSVRTGGANEAGQGQNLPGSQTQDAGTAEVQGGGVVQTTQGEVNGAQTAETTVPAVQEKARQGNAVQAGLAKVVQALTPAQREYFAVAEEVAGTGVADHDAEIARKLGVTRQAVLDRKKRALAAILKKIKSEYGLDEAQAREVLKAHFTSKRVTEMADETALGMEPGRQAQKVGTEEVFGDSERGGGQQMSIVDSAGKTTEDPFGDMTGNAGNVEGTKLLEAAGAIGDGGLTKTETSDATPGEKQKAAAEQERAARKAQEQLIEQMVATDPNYQFAVNDFNEFKPEGALEFSALASVDKLDYIEWWVENRDAIFEATNGQLDRIFGGYFGNINYKAVDGAPKENRSVAQDAVKRIESKDSGNAPEAARNPVEQRVDALKAKLGEKQQKGVDRLIARYQKGEIDLGRLNDELDNYDGQLEEGIKFSEDKGVQKKAAIFAKLAKLYGGEDEARKANQLVDAYLGFFDADTRAKYSPANSGFARQIKAVSNHIYRTLEKGAGALRPVEYSDEKIGPYDGVVITGAYNSKTGVLELLYVPLMWKEEVSRHLRRADVKQAIRDGHFSAHDVIRDFSVLRYEYYMQDSRMDSDNVHDTLDDVGSLRVWGPESGSTAERWAIADGALHETGQFWAEDSGLTNDPITALNDVSLSDTVNHLANLHAVVRAFTGANVVPFHWERITGASAEYDAGTNSITGRKGAAALSEGSPVRGTTPQAIRSALAKLFFSPARLDQFIRIYATQAEAVAEGVFSQRDSKIKGFTTADGKVGLIAENIPEGKELGVILHEIGVHLGMEKLVGAENMEWLAGRVDVWRQRNDNSVEARVARWAYEKALDSSSENRQEELIAYMVEGLVNEGITPQAAGVSEAHQWFRKLWAAAKAALRKLGFKNPSFSGQNLVDLAYGAADLELQGAWHGTAADFRRFDHRYMGTGEGAQAYGWGTYLAQRSGIAYEYWKADVGRKGGFATYSAAVDHLLNTVDNERRTDWTLRSLLKAAGIPQDAVANIPIDIDAVVDLANKGQFGKTIRAKLLGRGSLMRVATNVRDDELLDWDKPLSEQQNITDKLENFKKVTHRVHGAMYEFDTPKGQLTVEATYNGDDLYRSLQHLYGSDKAASEYLDSIGIKGIKFLDSQSRSSANNKQQIEAYKDLIKELEVQRDRYLSDPYYATRETGNTLTTGQRLAKDTQASIDGYKAEVAKMEAYSPTHNLVIFNDKNIQRVASQVGASRESKNIRYSERKADNSIPAFTNDFSKNWWQYTKDMAEDWYNRGLMAAVFSHDLEKIAVKAGLTKATGFFELGHQKEAIRNRLETAAEAILAQSDKLTDRAEAESFLRDSTVDGKWGFAPEWDKTAVVDPTYAKRFKALTPEAQKVVKEVFKHGEDTYTAIRTELASEIAQEYDSLIEKETDPTAKARLVKDKEKATRMQARLLPKRDGPYAPLRRFGDYVFIGKSKEYAEAEKDKDTTRMNALIADPEKIHYLVEFYDNIAQAKARERQVGNRFHEHLASVKQKEFYDVDTVPWAGVQRLKSAISDAKDTKYKAAMQRIVTELYLQSVAETSARKAELSRKGTKERSGVAGSDDMFRGFAANAMASAHYVASLSKNKEVVKQISEMKAEAHDKSNGDERHEATRALNEVMARYAQGLNYRPTPVVDKMLRVSSVWMLMTSPAYYLQNSMQPFMFSAPYMAGRKGVGIDGAFSALTTAYKQTAKFVKNMGAELDIESMPISAAEKKMLHEMWNNGKLDIGINAELGRWKNASGKDPIPILSTTMRRLDKAMLQVETLNRVTTALAAYRVSNGDSKYVAEVLDNTHGNYAKSNAPRFFHANGLTKLTMQFKKYQLIQMSLLVRMAHKAFAGASAEEKSVGRAALLWLLGQHLAVTGLAGTVPVALLMAAGAIGGDDDKDWERNLRKYIGDDKVSDLLLHGVPAALGLDVSKKLGISNAFSLLPFTDVPTDKSGYEKAIVSLSGAFIGGLGSRTFDAIGQMGKGNYYKGVEQLLPRGPSDAMKAYRFYTEGVTNRRNDTLLKPDDITLVDAMMQGVGLPSTTITNFQRQRGDVFELSKHFKEKDQSLSDQYNAAKKAGDTEEMADLRQEYMEVQQSKKRWIEELRRQGFTSKEMAKELQPHPLSTLMKGASNQMKREAKWGHSAAA